MFEVKNYCRGSSQQVEKFFFAFNKAKIIKVKINDLKNAVNDTIEG
jgi:hypothetical protein